MSPSHTFGSRGAHAQARPDASPIRALVIDDHELIRSALREMIENKLSPCVVVEAGSAASALNEAAKGKWDVIVLDIDLPDRSGLDLLRDLLAQSPKNKVLMLTGLPEKEFARRALAAGAFGYIEKSINTARVVEAVQRILEGKKYISPDLAAALIDNPIAGASKLHDALSPREFEVLRLYGTGRKLAEIAESLGLSVKTAGTYRARILEKLSLQSTGDIVAYAVRERLV
jgi:two-component system invasion response regulator UvrY